MKNVALHVLGCRVNQNEADAILALFHKHGYTTVDFNDKADVYIIHTCSVTHMSDRKSRQMIRKAIKKNPQAIIAVTGCYAQSSPGEILAIEGVDIVLGNQDRQKLVEIVEGYQKGAAQINWTSDILKTSLYEELPVESTERVRAFVKIEEGCSQFCSYCIIPFTRGPVRSRDPWKTLVEIQELLHKGYSEIVLTGIHTGKYGEDLVAPYDFTWLIKEIVKLEGLKRLRFSSLDPNEFSAELVDVLITNPLIMPSYHIALQSGSDKILTLMRRKYDLATYKSLIKKLQICLPLLNVTTDIMVGFPGETEEDHQASLDFVKRIGFGSMHVFPYSKRKGTKAALFNEQVSDQDKEQRSKDMLTLAAQQQQLFQQKFIGSKLEVLFEQQQNGLWFGHTVNFLKVAVESTADLRGAYFMVQLKSSSADYLKGELC